jgi:hypothetical protein
MNIERSIKRCKDMIQKLEENKDNLGIYGYWSLGYWKGRLSALEDTYEDNRKEIIK